MQSLANPARALGAPDRPLIDGSHVRGRRFPWLAGAITAVVVLGCTGLVIDQVDPSLIFGPNMDVGGDNAGHVVAVSFFVHQLLPHGALSGWDPEWFGGFPLYVFYFPLPAVLVGALNPIFHLAVAFKLVSVLGTVAMPVSGYLFGRLSGLARPYPALFSLAMLPFLFNTSYTIDGGNLASTLAGEFSFTLAMAFGLIFLGAYVRALRTGRMRWLAALLFAATALCHVVPALFFAGAAVVVTVLLTPGRRSTLKVLVPVGIVGTLLAGFFLLPFAADLRYSTSMGYTRVGDPFGQFFPHSAELAVQCLAGVGLVIGLVRRDRFALSLAVMSIGSALAFVALPSGLVYNARWLPFWFLSTCLLGAMGLGLLGHELLGLAGHAGLNEKLTPIVTALVTVGVTCYFLGALPFYSTPSGRESFIPYWVSWNYSGYQAKPGWGEFERLVSMVDTAAKSHGCGRLDYEYSPNWTDTFGSSLVPMSFPLWTNGCIDSAEGLYYESSTSTDFHFLDQSELSIGSSDPVVGIPYQPLDVADGVRHLALTGVKYFLANSVTVEDQAADDPDLEKLAEMPESAGIEDTAAAGGATTPGKAAWVLYLVTDSALVTPLSYKPVVEPGLASATWRETTIAWYQDESAWDVPIATTGPASWLRVRNGELVTSPEKRLRSDKVTDIATTNETVSFHVSRLGVPVYVKVPYFPNWQASGAKGPYLTTPNLMTVVPTRHDVVLSYTTTTADWLGRAASLIGIAGLFLLYRPGFVPIGAIGVTGDDETAEEGGTRDEEGSPFGETTGSGDGHFALVPDEPEAADTT